MELVFLLLLGGLVALWLMNRALKQRLDRLERRLEVLALSGCVAGSVEAGAVEPIRTPAVEQGSDEGDNLAGLFERLVGGRLLIWTGGVTLVLAAIFLVRYSIEIGLITPEVRMIAAAVFGLLLLAGGEAATRSAGLRDDPRVSQALVGAGLAVLYATVYGSHILHGFLSLGVASALMVALTAAALGLSLRHGAPTAALGLAGGFAVPLLLGERLGALPLLGYLALLDLAVLGLALRRGWLWLAIVAVLGSFAWSFTLLFGDSGDALAAGWFVLILGVAAAAPTSRITILVPVLVIAAVQLAMLVLRDDVGAIAWLQFGAVAAASLVLSRLRGQDPWAPLLILLLALLLIPLKASLGDDPMLPWAAAFLCLLFGGGGLAVAIDRRDGFWAALACFGFAGPLLALRWSLPDALPQASWGVATAVIAIGPAWLVRARREGPDRGKAAAALLAALTAAALCAHACSDLVAEDGLSVAWAALAILLIATGMRLKERSLRVAGLLILALAVSKLFLVDAAALQGVLRIFSFLAFGIALIGIGRLYGPIVRTGGGKAVAEDP